jgi:hypothetical protein
LIVIVAVVLVLVVIVVAVKQAGAKQSSENGSGAVNAFENPMYAGGAETVHWQQPKQQQQRRQQQQQPTSGYQDVSGAQGVGGTQEARAPTSVGGYMDVSPTGAAKASDSEGVDSDEEV